MITYRINCQLPSLQHLSRVEYSPKIIAINLKVYLHFANSSSILHIYLAQAVAMCPKNHPYQSFLETLGPKIQECHLPHWTSKQSPHLVSA